MKKSMKNAVISLFFYMVSAFGMSLCIEATVGVSSFNAMTLSIAEVSTIRVGTVTTIANLTFLLGYMVLSRFQYPWRYALQAGATLIFGEFVNFFTYTLFASIELSSYALQVAALSAGTIISGLAVGIIIHYGVLTFPIENFCLEVEARCKLSFAVLRYGTDVFFLVASVLISWAFALPQFIREGTVINMILLTGSMNLVQIIYRRSSRQKSACHVNR